MNQSLPNVTLAAIVRDEMMNPAGGIRDFIDSTAPFVEEVLVVDTGSVDGTRQALEDLKRNYAHLKVLDTKFEGYAQARNFNLDQIRNGRRVLVLDADERLTRDDFGRIQSKLQHRDYPFWSFDFVNITPNGDELTNAWTTRLFQKAPGLKFENNNRVKKAYENLYQGNTSITARPIEVTIKHFVQDSVFMEEKRKDWYDGVLISAQRSAQPIPPPSTVPSYPEWKAYNPRREQYR